MDMPERELRERRDTLARIRLELEEQDTLILELIRRMPNSAVHAAQQEVLEDIFQELRRIAPQLGITFRRSDDPDGLRPQLRSAGAKIDQQIKTCEDELGVSLTALEANSITEQRPSRLRPDPRRILVIHGRNPLARDAMFRFLRSVDLNPFEWEEAIAETQHSSAYVGQALEAAFSKAQAAIVLLTGDDWACLNRKYVKPSDPAWERELTPQARPNVLFEAGMALGHDPRRTVIVEIGTTRPFSDTFGRHTVRLSNSTESRMALISRLHIAGCELNSEHKQDWIREGDFELATPQIDGDPCAITNDPSLVGEKERLEQELAHERARHDADNARGEVALLNLQAELDQTRATHATLLSNRESEIDALRKALASQRATAAAVGGHSTTRAIPTVTNKLPLFDAASKTLHFSWPEDVALEVVWNESGTYGFVAYFANNTPDYIAAYQVEVTEANPWSERHETFLPNRAFSRRLIQTGKNIEPLHKTNGQWLIRALNKGGSNRLAVGNDDSSQLGWPNNDPTTIEIWRLTLASAFEAQPNSKSGLKRLPAAYLVVRWDRENGTMQMAKYESQT